MNPFTWINSQPWLRPSLFVLSAVASLVKVVTPNYTVAHRVADYVLNGALPFGIGSLGTSNSGIKPAVGQAVKVDYGK